MKVYTSKLDWVETFLTPELEVLDLGCVCHDLSQTAVPWLHGFIHDRVKRVVGVDYLPEAIDQLREDGFDVCCADVQQMNLGESFDLIVAGDIIEHLDNIGLFLDRCREHLKPGGKLLVTTPNPVNEVRFARVFFDGTPGGNREHTCWFTFKMLEQLAARHGLRAAEKAVVDDTRLFYPWRKPLAGLSPSRWFWRNVERFFKMFFIWNPILIWNSIYTRLRPENAETLCVAFEVSQEDIDS